MRYLFIKIFFMLFVFPWAVAASHRLPEPIVLKTASLIDGSFITWRTLAEIVYPFTQRLHERVFGIITPAGVQGLYHYNNNDYTLDELADHVRQGQTNEHFDSLFEYIKEDLIALGSEFFAGTERAKPVIAHLVKESCAARGKKDSLLMVWTRAKDHQEKELLHAHIKTIDALCNFCIDLLTFLHDFVHSCPKACKQLHLELEKWHKVKALIASIEKESITFVHAEKSEFLHYLRQYALPHALIDQINVEWVYNQYDAFHGKRQ